jgi:hypothetical protein
MSEPTTGFPGDAEGAWAGEPGAVLEGGGQIASRGVGDLEELPAGAASVLGGITDITGAMGPKRYVIDSSGNRAGPAARPGE